MDYEVRIVVTNLSAEVIDLYWPLASDSQANGLQLEREGLLIDLLQESIAQLVIDVVERLDDLSGQVLMHQSHNLNP